MKTLVDYIIERSLINFGAANVNYGQCIILAGGAASGKGYIQRKILTNCAVFDVDEMKKQYIKLQKKGIIDDTKKYDMSKTSDTSELHMAVKNRGTDKGHRGWPKEKVAMFWKQRKDDLENGKSSQSKLPNILFDKVSDEISDIVAIATVAKKYGYNVSIIWVVCNADTARIGNVIRDRTVDDSIIVKGHKGAYDVMTGLLGNKYPDVAKYIDTAWIGLSCGYARKFEKEYLASSNEKGSKENTDKIVTKIKKSGEDKFTGFDKGFVDKFLSHQQPIDYDKLNANLNSPEANVKAQAEKFVKTAKDVDKSKLNNVSESLTYDSEQEYINILTNAFSEFFSK